MDCRFQGRLNHDLKLKYVTLQLFSSGSEKMKKILTVLLLTCVILVSGCVGDTTGQTVAKEIKTEEPKITTTICTPDWDCGDWLKCNTYGSKKRICKDLNNCNSNTDKPETTSKCDYLSEIALTKLDLHDFRLNNSEREEFTKGTKITNTFVSNEYDNKILMHLLVGYSDDKTAKEVMNGLTQEETELYSVTENKEFLVSGYWGHKTQIKVFLRDYNALSILILGDYNYNKEDIEKIISTATEKMKINFEKENLDSVLNKLKSPSVGDVLEIEDMKYSIEEVFTSDVLGNYLYQEADGIYVIVKLSIENAGKNSVYVNYEDFKIVDNQGRIYDVDMMGNVYLETMGFSALPSYKKIGPGLTTNGYIVFDVPENDKGLSLAVKEPYTRFIMIGDISDL